MKLFCNECKTYIEVYENDVKYTPGETVSMECPHCGEPIEFTVPSRDNNTSQEQSASEQIEKDSVEKQPTSDQKDMSEMERRIQELELMVAKQNAALGYKQNDEENETSVSEPDDIPVPEEDDAPEPEKNEIEDTVRPYIPSYAPQEHETMEVVQHYRYDDYDEEFTNVGMFKRPFSFKGRIRRAEYWISSIIFDILWYWFWLRHYFYGGLINFAVLVILAWFLLAQNAKRCHDRDNSGWYQLIPFYGLWLLFADGDEGNNSYGDNPKGLHKTIRTAKPVVQRQQTNTLLTTPSVKSQPKQSNASAEDKISKKTSLMPVWFFVMLVIAAAVGTYCVFSTGKLNANNGTLDSTFVSALDSSMIDMEGGKVYVQNEYITDHKGRTYLNIYEKKEKAYTKDFKITCTPITVDQWNEVMGISGWFSSSSSGMKYKLATHEEAMKFVSKLNARTNRNYSLPTQAQMTLAWKDDKCQKEEVLSTALTSTVCSYQHVDSNLTANDTVYVAVTCLSDGKARGDGSTMAHAFYVVLEENK